ncbi:MAG: TetR family transcriptional regulator [Spirochaetaceae bacterium]|nr:TetR family transcriptional regulator [Spirochaetaceae bacterium]
MSARRKSDSNRRQPAAGKHQERTPQPGPSKQPGARNKSTRQTVSKSAPKKGSRNATTAAEGGTTKKTRKSPTLSVEFIVATAIGLADRGGIHALSMRNLATELRVEAMSLYHHIPSRERLLDLMVDEVFGELGTPATDAQISWQEWLSVQSNRMRKVLLDHPWAVGLLDSRKNPGPATLQYQNHRLGRLRQAGFSMDLAAHTVAIQDSFVYGFVVQELALPFEGAVDIEQLQGFQDAMQAGDYPYLSEMVASVVSQRGYSFAREFEYGLKLIIEGLEMRFRN